MTVQRCRPDVIAKLMKVCIGRRGVSFNKIEVGTHRQTRSGVAQHNNKLDTTLVSQNQSYKHKQHKHKVQSMTANKKQHQQEKQFCFIFFVLMLVVMLACNSTMAFSSIQVAAPWGATMPSWESASSWGTTSWTATTRTVDTPSATSTTLFGWSVPTSVWTIEANPTARKVVYYDE